jgi:transcriptional regulator with GAF, ATPase, and Fis domain
VTGGKKVSVTEKERLLDSLRQLSNLLLSEETLRSSLKRVAYLSVRAMDACDAAGVSVVDGSQVVTIASSDASVEAIDEIQYTTEQGPCLQAIRDGEIFKIDSMTEDSRWPEFTRLAIQSGLMACLALPLIEDGSTFGSLTLYSYHDRKFDLEDEKSGVALAAQASGPLSNMRRYEKLQHISSRLSQANEVPLAVAAGVLMERNGCSREKAMSMIRGLAASDHGDMEAAARSVVDSIASKPQ